MPAGVGKQLESAQHSLGATAKLARSHTGLSRRMYANAAKNCTHAEGVKRTEKQTTRLYSIVLPNWIV